MITNEVVKTRVQTHACYNAGRMQYDMYIVCHDHIERVADFVSTFFEEESGPYNFAGWRTFIVPGTEFRVNLMTGNDQVLTQNVVLEMYATTYDELEQYAAEYGEQIASFDVDDTGHPYRYHYVFLEGPEHICNVEVNYIEN